MKNLILIFLIAMMAGCVSINSDTIVGKWQTDIIKSEWGPLVSTLTFSSDGHVILKNKFGEAKESLRMTGTYTKTNNTLICTFADDHGGWDKSEIEIINKSTLKLKEKDEVFEFKRVRNPRRK